jgi:hypothetical protein
MSDGLQESAAAGSIPHIDYANHPAYGLMFEPDAALAVQAQAELGPLIEQSARDQATRDARMAARTGPRGAISQSLHDDAFAKLQAEGQTFETLAGALKSKVERVRGRVRAAREADEPITFKLSQELLDRTADEPAWAAANALLRELGILDAAVDYFGADGCKLKAAAVMVNWPGQSWTCNLFRDVEVETPATAGFHIDSDAACLIKTVVYLDDVGIEQGPFSVVPGSNHWDRTGPARARRRGYDKSSIMSRNPSKRRMFLSLPPELRVKAEFGGDMLPDAPETKALLEAETRMTGPRGQVNIFDPEAIHRGGQVESGERVVLLASIAAGWKTPK